MSEEYNDELNNGLNDEQENKSPESTSDSIPESNTENTGDNIPENSTENIDGNAPESNNDNTTGNSSQQQQFNPEFVNRNTGYNYQNTYQQPQPPKKKKGNKLAIIVTVCILLVVMLVGTVVIGSVVYIANYISNYNENQGEETAPVNTDVNTIEPDNTSSVKAPITDPDIILPVGSSTETYSMKDVAAMTVNTVVEIRTESATTGSFMQQYITEGAGSGVIISKDGYIATNNHVIEGATNITVYLRNGTKYSAVLVGTDEKTDVAVIKIEATGLTPATFGDSDKLVVAETVIAIGNPLGELGGSVTDGIISALSRTVTVESQQMTLLQTTAAVNPGNSGGGLFNMSGELIGLVNAKSSGEDIEGIGFAIPSNTAKAAIEDIIKYGYVKGRVMLGVRPLDILDNYTAAQYRVNKLGVYIYSVATNSDAEKAGLKSGDLIKSFGTTEITSSTQLKSLIQNYTVGSTETIKIIRGNEEKTFTITFTEYNPNTVTFGE